MLDMAIVGIGAWLTYWNKNFFNAFSDYDYDLVWKLMLEALCIAICGIVAITGWRKEFFMIYGTCYAMHLIVNTYVRLKFYCEMSEYKSLILSIIKGILCVFIPSLIIQKCIFGEFGDTSMLIVMGISMVISAFLIDYEKKDVKKEEILVSNGYLHMAIVLALTVMLGISQFLIINCKF
jgi:predicted MFS family arabinose efflux permease